ncbi:uncharacterized protein A4U43_C04F14920 [Asparagus officinalis]|uniref:Uncharacterized protein n=1 Tax=Asparagus officinalis TaxID=4686 RepID=A0A5P1F6B3_ASPOF|nr:uncharacterized protein A4U43_C04F14920 [Asparagus officinalis]
MKPMSKNILVSLGVDTKPQREIGRKDEAEKEDDQGKEMEEVKDDRADMGIDVEEPVDVKVIEEVIVMKKGRKRRKEIDEMLQNLFGAMGKEPENNKEAQILRISVPNSYP